MGTLIGHVLPGCGFILVGLWQLFNHIKLHGERPGERTKLPAWFPFPGVRRLELYLVLFGSLASVAAELFVGPARHHPLDPADWTIPANHLHNFEHATGSLSIFLYGAVAHRLDRAPPPPGAHTVALLAGATAFAVQFFVFYLHSTDHTGLEWQYHALLQVILAAGLVTTLLGVGRPRSFAVGFTRSACVLFQGVWSSVMGVMLYTPRLLPKGCRLRSDDGFLVVPCDGRASLDRAKSLANLQFAWSFLAVVIFSGWFYLYLSNKYRKVPDQSPSPPPEFPPSPEKKLARPVPRSKRG